MTSLAQIILKIIGAVLAVRDIQRSFHKYVEVVIGLITQPTLETVVDARVPIQAAVKCVKYTYEVGMLRPNIFE
jgi:hypothetical protein